MYENIINRKLILDFRKMRNFFITLHNFHMLFLGIFFVSFMHLFHIFLHEWRYFYGNFSECRQLDLCLIFEHFMPSTCKMVRFPSSNKAAK